MAAQHTSDSKEDSESPINNLHCRAKTKKDQQCLVRVKAGNYYCSRHAKLFKFPKPEECPICLEPSETMPQPLSCGHWICRKCITKWKAECPVCRAPVQVTKREKKQIENLPTNRNESEDLTAQAIALFLASPETGEDQSSEIVDIYVDDSADFNLFTAFVLSHMSGMRNFLVR